MTQSAPTHFNCPNCGARYKVVRIEVPPGLADDPVSCVSCGAPIASHEGQLALKYFQVERSARHRRVARPA
jgi:predicted Zn finger-like uncharacterized protein